MKANHIYLRRLRDNDFVDRLEEEEVFRPTTIEDVRNALISMNNAMNKVMMQQKLYQPRPTFEKGTA
jgi:hypothetical protein